MIDILINGKAEQMLNVNDRGLQYGDGLFETMAVRNGKITFWQYHWARLQLGCEKLSINKPSKQLIEEEILTLTNERDEANFVIKLILTRGQSQRGYQYSEQQNVTRILTSHSMPNYSNSYKTEGVKVRYCDTQLSENKSLAGIKHLNRLEQVLARNEWHDEYQEGLMCSQSGAVIDGTMSNLFIVQDNVLYTPRLTLCGVNGVMRQVIIELSSKLNFSLEEKEITKDDIKNASEVFLSNSLFTVWPIKQINKHQYKTGSITKSLQKEVNKLCQ